MKLNKKLKSFFSLLCAVSLLLSVCSTPTLAVTANAVTAKTNTSVKQGNSAYCYISIDSMESLASLDVTVHFDPTKVKIKSVYNSVGCTLYDSATKESEINFSYIFDGNGSATKTQLFYFNYQVLSDAEVGDAYFDITVGEAYDDSLNVVDVVGSRCSFSIAETVLNQSCSVYGTGTVSTSIEREFSLSYRFSTSKIASGSVVISYDPELFEVVSVSNGGLLSGKVSDVNVDLAGSVYLSFVGATCNSYTDLVTVTFRTLKNVTETSKIRFTATELCDEELNPFSCSGYTTTVNVAVDETYVGDAPKMWVDAEFNEETKQVVAAIRLEEGSGLGAGDFVLNFDPTVLSVDSYEKGFDPDFFDVNETDLAAGSFKFYLISMEDVLSAETVVTVVFDAKQDYEDQVVSLDLSGSMLTDSQTNTIALNLIDGAVTVPQKKIISIDISSLPSKLEYLEEEDLDLADGKLTLLCDDGTTDVIDLSEATVEGFDNTKIGVQALIVSFNGKTTTFDVMVRAKSLVSLGVSNPSKTDYLEGKDALDLSGGKLILYYDNGTSEKIDLSLAAVTGFDNTKVGEQILTVTYGGLSTTFKVKIVAKSLTSIAVTQLPSKLTYLEGEASALDLTGMVVTAYYDNGTSEEITGYTTSGYKLYTLGVQTITVSYKGKTATFTVTVKSRYFPAGLGTKESPFVIETAEQLNYVRMYNYDQRYFVLANDIEFSDWDFSEYGDYYNDGFGWAPIGSFVDPFCGVFDGNGHVIKNLKITVISDDGGQEVGLFGLNEGTVKNVGLENCTITFADFFAQETYFIGSIVGENCGTVQNCYSSGSIDFAVRNSEYTFCIGGIVGMNTSGIVENCYNLSSLSVSQLYTGACVGGIVGKNDYAVMNCFNVGDVYAANYHNVGGISGDNRGTIDYCYNCGGVTGAWSGGISGDNNGDITDCYYVDSISQGVGSGTPAGVSCTIDDMTQQYTFSGFDFDTVWTMGGNDDYRYPELRSVAMQFTKEITSVEILLMPKYEYLEGKDELDLSGGLLEITYSNGEFEYVDLANATVTGFDNTQVGEQVLTVTYGGMTTTFPVKVIRKSLAGISVSKKPTKTKYLEGKDALDLTGGKLTLTYNNDMTEEIDLSEATVTGFDNAKVGMQTLSVSYGGMSNVFSVTVVTKYFASGIGTEEDPYVIKTKEQLNNVRYHLDAHYILANDIVFTDADFAKGGTFYNDGAGWTPIGIDSNNFFTGTFDGNGYTIKNLYINISGSSTIYAGLFGYSTGTIKNLGMIDGAITAEKMPSSHALAYVGGIVGYAYSGTVSNCYNTGTVGSSYCAGGIVGYSCGTVTNCYNSGNVEGGFAGGIVGELRPSGIVTSCYNTGGVKAYNYYAGGIVGYSNSGTVSSCYNRGNVEAPDAGGIVGYLSSSGTVTNCYNAGTVDGSSNAGGIVGWSASGAMSNCYNTGNVEGSNAGAIVGQLSSSNNWGGWLYPADDNGAIGSDVYYQIKEGEKLTYTVKPEKNKMPSKLRLTVFTRDNVDITEDIWKTFDMKITKTSAVVKEPYSGTELTLDWKGGAFYNSAEPNTGVAATRKYVVVPCTEGETFKVVSPSNGWKVWIYPADENGSIESKYYGLENGGTYTVEAINGKMPTALRITTHLLPDGVISDDAWAARDLVILSGRVVEEAPPATSDAEVVTAEWKPGQFYNSAEPVAHTKRYYTVIPCKEGDVFEFYASSDTVTNCYYLDTAAKGVGSGTDNCTKCSIAQMMQQTTFAEFDFDTVWTMSGNSDYLYPELQDVEMQFTKELVSIAVITKPNKTEYLEAKDVLDLFGGKLTLYYNNDTTEEIDLSKATVVGFDNTVVGEQTLTVTYNGKTTTFKVKIIAKSLVSIAVLKNPTKTEYLEVKDSLDLTGGKLALYYDNDTTQEINLSSATVTGFDNTKVGEQTLTVTYNGKTTTFNVTVVAKTLVSIAVTTPPDKTEYVEGDPLDLSGGKLLLTYNNDTTKEIDLSEATVTGFDSSYIGEQILTVTCEGKTCTFNVTVDVAYIPGDVDGNEELNSDDAVYLLGHTLFAEYYPISQPCDFDGNGQVNSDDATYLLGHTLFPEYYPLH